MKRKLTVNPSGDADDEPLFHVVPRLGRLHGLVEMGAPKMETSRQQRGSDPSPLLLAIRTPSPHHEKVPNQSTLLQPLLRALKAAHTPHFPLATDPKQAYALGLFTFQLLTTEMNVVTNTDVIITPYRIGAHSPSMTVVGHTGELGGFLSAYWTFHDEDSAVVMLFELQLQVDFLGVATEIVTNVRARWDTLVHEWTAHRIQSTDPSDSKTYAGTYTNTGLAMTLEVVPTDIDRSAGHGMWDGTRRGNRLTGQ
ncbi:hypothetical protein BDW60DRAFT_207128 [Aspergillus nidulans var. acristatus]